MRQKKNSSRKSRLSSIYIVTEPFDRIHQFAIVDTCNFFCKIGSSKIILTAIQNIRPNKLAPGTGEIISYIGSIKNLIVVWTAEFIWVTGSLAKYHYGNNLNLLTRQQTRFVIIELSGILGIDLMQAKIKRLDPAFNVPTALPARNYFPFFETKSRMVRNDSGANTLYFGNRHKQIVIYDKKKELWEVHKIKIQDEELTRVELRLFKPAIRNYMNSKYGKAYLTVADLLKRDVFLDFIRLIHNEYETIVKRRSHYFVLSLCKKPNDVVILLALNGIESFGGLEEVLQIVENSKALCEVPYPEFISRLKSIIRKIATSDNFTRKFEEISKLDNQVRFITKCSLMCNWFG